MTRKALGRGLEALLGPREERAPESAPAAPTAPTPPLAEAGEGLMEIPVSQIQPNPQQPRRSFNEAKLKELADSIAAEGVLQPPLVTKREDGQGYYLIAGERRWQAAQKAGLAAIPCLVKEAAPVERLTLALIENIQRQDLNPLEEADAYVRLNEDHGLSQEKIAEAVGRERATVANYMRLTKLPQEIQGDLEEGRLTMGHARALLGLLDLAPQLGLARAKVLKERLNVRQTEKLVEKLKKPAQPKQPSQEALVLKAESEELRRRLGTKVAITKKGRQGKITIEFYSEEELDRLLDWFKKA